MASVLDVQGSTDSSGVEPVRRRRWGLLTAVAALVVAAVVAAVWFVREGGNSEPVFNFETDSLCDWFAAEDVNQIIDDAQTRTGGSWNLPAFDAGDCVPSTGTIGMLGPEGGWIHARYQPDADGNQFLLPPALKVNMVPVAWTGLDPADDFVGHEMLDQSVTYTTSRYQSSWWDHIDVDLRIEGHDDDVLRFTLARQDPNSTFPHRDVSIEEQVTSLALVVADSMLSDMKWVE
jgi:hypothetical protein